MCEVSVCVNATDPLIIHDEKLEKRSETARNGTSRYI